MPAQDPQDDLLARQAQIAAKASMGVTPQPGSSFPTEKAVQTEKKVEETPELKPVEPSVEPVQPVAEPVAPTPPKDTVADDMPVVPTGDSTITYNPSPKTSSGENPDALLELTKADIFKLLGMANIPETEKKKNLDEMEETIWADFITEDLPGMLSPEEKTRFEEFLKTSPSAEKVINFFGSPPSGGLPQNFEEKYLSKTLEFKAEITKEQIATLLESVDDAAKKELLTKAKTAADQGFWKQVEDLMVTLG